MADHPGVPPPGACTYETYPFDHDPNWEAYARNVEIPEGTDRQAALEKVRQKWYHNNIGVHHEEFMAELEREAEGNKSDPLGGEEQFFSISFIIDSVAN